MIKIHYGKRLYVRKNHYILSFYDYFQDIALRAVRRLPVGFALHFDQAAVQAGVFKGEFFALIELCDGRLAGEQEFDAAVVKFVDEEEKTACGVFLVFIKHGYGDEADVGEAFADVDVVFLRVVAGA